MGVQHGLPKVKSLQALFALATEVLRLFGDFADQVLDSARGHGRVAEHQVFATRLWHIAIITYYIYVYIYIHI